MSWKEYFFALFLTNMVVLIFIFMILILQNYLPLSEGKGGLSIDLAFNTAVSFITDTNLQHLCRGPTTFKLLADDCNNIYHVCGTCFRDCSCICIHSLFYKKKFWSWKFLCGFYKDYSYTPSSSCNSIFTCIDGNWCPANSKLPYQH